LTHLNDTVLTTDTLWADALWVWTAKLMGAVAGSAVSLAYMLPSDRREAAIRFAVGIICGTVFGGVAGAKIAELLSLGDALGEAELMLTGAAAASLAAWSALGVFKRFMERLKQAPLPGILPMEKNDDGQS